MRLPFVCPMDHILVPEHFSDTPSLLHPPIGFREYSFLENPRTPASVRDRRVVVEVAQEGARLDDWDNTRKGLVTVLPQRTDAQLIKSLEAYKVRELENKNYFWQRVGVCFKVLSAGL